MTTRCSAEEQIELEQGAFLCCTFLRRNRFANGSQTRVSVVTPSFERYHGSSTTAPTRRGFSSPEPSIHSGRRRVPTKKVRATTSQRWPCSKILPATASLGHGTLSANRGRASTLTGRSLATSRRQKKTVSTCRN